MISGHYAHKTYQNLSIQRKVTERVSTKKYNGKYTEKMSSNLSEKDTEKKHMILLINSQRITFLLKRDVFLMLMFQ